ncbi:uncharacterized protein LOC134534888 isoform X2 [Bacillus rossius redtenbacheri]|uniref:uncharacterized protein LOC134534888 isoform X2 n=1 Tax=Bacillus rossius redtenbacheri TaxID=93214 RepID=UPI002FDE6196
MCDSAMDNRKRSFQVKLDLLILECNMVSNNINAVLQCWSSLVAHLLNETDYAQFSKNWPDVAVLLDAFIHPITEFNSVLDKQLRALPSVEAMFPPEPQLPSKKAIDSASKEDGVSSSETNSSASTQFQSLNGASSDSPSVQKPAYPSDAVRVPSLVVQSTMCSRGVTSVPSPLIRPFECSSNVPVVQPTSSTSVTSAQLPVVKQADIGVGSVLRMSFLHGDTPESFWLRFENCEEVNKAKKEMLKKIKTSVVSALDFCPRVGDHVCTVVGKSTVVRGEVRTMKKCGADGVKFVLFDVDDGTTHVVGSRNLWKQEPELAAVPAQAIHCRLKGTLGNVPPRAFVDMCTDRHLEVKICSLLKGSYPFYAVQLFSCDPANGNKVNVNNWVTKFFSSRSTSVSSKSSISSKETLAPLSTSTKVLKNVDTTKNSNERTAVNLAAESLKVDTHHVEEEHGNYNSSVKKEPSSDLVYFSNNKNNNQNDISSSPVSNFAVCIEPDVFPVHVKLVGEVTHCVSPSEFFVHVGSNKMKAHKLGEIMMSHYMQTIKTSNSKMDLKKRVGTNCVCKFEGFFFRAKILNWMLEDQENVLVQFIDYGHTGCVSFTSIQPLYHKFAECPGLANKCHLSNILPADSHGKVSNEWSADAIKCFCELVQQEVQFGVYVASKRINDPPDSLPVILVDERSDTNTILNDKLLSCGYAIAVTLDLSVESEEVKNGFVIDAPSPDSGADFEHFDPMTEDHESNMNTYDHDVEDARFVVSGWKSADEEQVCPLFRRFGYCRRPHGTCFKKHIHLDPNGIVTDKEPVFFRAFSDLVLPASRSFRVMLTEAHSLTVLYFVLVKEATNSGEAAEAEDEETLASLTAYMNEASNVRKMKRLLVPPALGQVVLAKDCHGLWCRATVIDWMGEKGGAEEFKVQLVDSGVKLNVIERDLRSIEPKYLHLPFQAEEFLLGNLELDALSDMEGEMYLKILRQMIGLEFTATVVSWRPSAGSRTPLEPSSS